MKPTRLEIEQAGCDEKPKRCVLCMLASKFLGIVNGTRALIGLCLLVMSHLGQIPDPGIARHSLYRT